MTEAGDVQVMSAGTGIFHSEHNQETKATNLFQIWIEPNQLNVEPRWDAEKFPKEPVVDKLRLLVSGDGKAPLFIHQDAYIYAGHLEVGTLVEHPIHSLAYLLVSQGELELNGQLLTKGDGASIREEDVVTLVAKSESEILVIDVPDKQ